MSKNKRGNMKFYSIVTLAWEYFKGNKKLRKICVLLIVSLITINLFTWLGLTYAIDDDVDHGAYMQGIEYSENGYQTSSLHGNINGINNIMTKAQMESVLKGDIEHVSSAVKSMYMTFDSNWVQFEYGGVKIGENGVDSIKFLDNEYNDYKLATDNLVTEINAYNDGKVLSHGVGFSGEDNREIIISRQVADFFTTNHKELIGEKMSVYVEEPMLRDYIIVGVISEEYEYKAEFDKSEIWLPLDSLDMDSLPVITISGGGVKEGIYFEQEETTLITYNTNDISALAESVVSTGRVFPYMNKHNAYSSSCGYNCVSYEPIYNFMIEFDSLSSAKTVFYKLDNYRRAEYLFVQSAFSVYMGYNPLRAVVNIVIGMLSIITLAVVMLSYFNSLSYDAKNKQSYIGVLQSMGASKRDVILIYLAEMLVMMMFIMLIVTIISALISMILMFSINGVITNIGGTQLISMLLNMNYFPISTFVIGGGVIGVGAIFVIIFSAGFFRKSIVQLLKCGK